MKKVDWKTSGKVSVLNVCTEEKSGNPDCYQTEVPVVSPDRGTSGISRQRYQWYLQTECHQWYLQTEVTSGISRQRYQWYLQTLRYQWYLQTEVPVVSPDRGTSGISRQRYQCPHDKDNCSPKILEKSSCDKHVIFVAGAAGLC